MASLYFININIIYKYWNSLYLKINNNYKKF